MNNRIFQSIKYIIRYRFNLDEDKASEDDVIENIKKSTEFKGINLWTLIFAILIASIGLNVNSTAVIIGAMLISPLMGPIMGMGLGAGIFDINLIRKAAKNLIIATLIGLVTSYLYFLISPLNIAQSELVARTTPTIYDVLIAFFGGLAGIVASSRKKYNNVIPGVAIATALMPPLCTAGYGIATGQFSFFLGAFYLYLINSVFISIATFLMVRFLKFHPVTYVNPQTSDKIKKWIGTIAALMILPSLFLAYTFVNNEIFIQNANQLINEEIAPLNYTILNKKINPDKKEIVVTLIGDNISDSLSNQINLTKNKYGLSAAVLILKNSITSDNNKPDLNELKEGIIEDMFLKQEELLRMKNDEISELKKQIEAQVDFNTQKENTIQEFYALYGKPYELIIEKSTNHLQDSAYSTLLVYIKKSKSYLNQKDLDKLKDWLIIKFDVYNVKIIQE
ncbi:MAG: DUF389 domain-containing protein [Sphingobacteriaceae bacterium]|nr:DUF389 domain-containing protein [Sphingobacteriaceae bacterium]